MNRNACSCLIIIECPVHDDRNGHDFQSPREEEQLLNNLKQILGLGRGGVIGRRTNANKGNSVQLPIIPQHYFTFKKKKKKAMPPTCFPLDYVLNKEIIVS